MKASLLLTLALVCTAGDAVTPRPASAQITTTIAPPRPAKERAPVTRTDSVRRADSISTAGRLQQMKAWVDSVAVAIAAAPSVPAVADSQVVTDSAAGARTPPRTPAPGADSVARDTVTVVVDGQVAPETRARGDDALRAGTPAPDTATPLPLLLLAAAASTLAGALLRRRR